MKSETNPDLLLPSDAARILERAPSTVRHYSDTGMLPTIKTATGSRLFFRKDVEALAEKLRRNNG